MITAIASTGTAIRTTHTPSSRAALARAPRLAEVRSLEGLNRSLEEVIRLALEVLTSGSA